MIGVIPYEYNSYIWNKQWGRQGASHIPYIQGKKNAKNFIIPSAPKAPPKIQSFQ